MWNRRFATSQLPVEKAKETFKIGRFICEVAREKTDLSEEELDETLNAHKTMRA